MYITGADKIYCYTHKYNYGSLHTLKCVTAADHGVCVSLL